jgi:hypothetical protein
MAPPVGLRGKGGRRLATRLTDDRLARLGVLWPLDLRNDGGSLEEDRGSGGACRGWGPREAVVGQ